MFIIHYSTLFSHYERNNLEYDLKYTNTTLAGLSIGLLAGAAVAVSSSIAELVRAGAESVRTSFRLGVYVDNISKSLESCEGEGNLESWAYVVTGLEIEDVKREIDEYNRKTVCALRLLSKQPENLPFPVESRNDQSIHQRGRQELCQCYWPSFPTQRRVSGLAKT